MLMKKSNKFMKKEVFLKIKYLLTNLNLSKLPSNKQDNTAVIEKAHSFNN